MEAQKFIRIMELRREINSALAVVARNTDENISNSDRLSWELAIKASEHLTALLKQLLEES